MSIQKLWKEGRGAISYSLVCECPDILIMLNGKFPPNDRIRVAREKPRALQMEGIDVKVRNNRTRLGTIVKDC
jgi:hypothetical protein